MANQSHSKSNIGKNQTIGQEAPANSNPSSGSRQLASRISDFLKPTSYLRLEASIGPFRNEMELWHELHPGSESSKYKRYENARSSINEAEASLGKYKTQLAWKHYFKAVCQAAFLLEGTELRNVANVTLLEAEEKLDGWRRKAVVGALCDSKGNLKKVSASEEDDQVNDDETLTHHDLYVALETLTEHHNNRYIKLDIAHRQLMLLLLSAIGLMPLGILALHYSPRTFEITNLVFLAAIAIFGAIGGTITGLITISRGSKKSKIPDQILSSWTTMSKPIFGAISGLVVSLFVFAGLFLGGFSVNSTSTYLVISLAILAGFSERFLLNVLGENETQRTQKEIVERLDEVTTKIRAITSSKTEDGSK